MSFKTCRKNRFISFAASNSSGRNGDLVVTSEDESASQTYTWPDKKVCLASSQNLVLSIFFFFYVNDFTTDAFDDLEFSEMLLDMSSDSECFDSHTTAIES